MRVCSGQPYPLGATWNGSGVNFALFSEHATAVELCLFGHPRGEGEEERIVLHAHSRESGTSSCRRLVLGSSTGIG